MGGAGEDRQDIRLTGVTQRILQQRPPTSDHALNVALSFANDTPKHPGGP